MNKSLEFAEQALPSPRRETACITGPQRGNDRGRLAGKMRAHGLRDISA
jgi:hypothetical protein